VGLALLYPMKAGVLRIKKAIRIFKQR
jgi:hypothetical protein